MTSVTRPGPIQSADISPSSELARLALAAASRRDRPAWAALLALDETLGRAASQAREPLLGQIRLAWWRERLGQGSTSEGEDPVLGAIDCAFGPRRAALVVLVDGWEQLLDPPPLSQTALEGFAEGRARAFAELAAVLDCGAPNDSVRGAAQLWALADFAAHCSRADEAATALALAGPMAEPRQALPRRMRPLAVLAGMARRAVRSGGGTLLGDRLSPFVAARIALMGR